MEGFLRWQVPPSIRRLATRGAAVVPALGVIAVSGEGGMAQLLILSQVVLSLQLSFAVVPLLIFYQRPQFDGSLCQSLLDPSGRRSCHRSGRRDQWLAGMADIFLSTRKPIDAMAPRPRRLGTRSGVLGGTGLRVDVEIDNFDAGLRLDVAGAGVPGIITEPNLADLEKPKAAPLTSARQTALALATELVSQRDLPPLRMAKDDGAKLARVAPVAAKDLLSAGDCLPEQLVNWAWQGILG
jgi:hypothetical protein